MSNGVPDNPACVRREGGEGLAGCQQSSTVYSMRMIICFGV